MIMKIAVEGCAHGELDKIYEALEHLQNTNNIKVDLLIICGDFQSVRNYDDLQCMAVPAKFQKLNTFYKYYSGEKVAPVLTIFIGGNHEASNYLSELSYGGWVCPKIYYLGYANVLNIGGLRIAGISGIYKGQDYLKGHFEFPPYSESEKRSVYHIRNLDVFRLKQLKQPIDIFISHDWPRGIYNFGNKEDLLRWKPFFKDEMDNNKLGSRPAEDLLNILRPSYWFAAHLHCKFAAVVPHENNGVKTTTKFLALDKCLPRRKFMHLIDIQKGSELPNSLHYDPEWLCILQSTNHLLSTDKGQTYMPGPGCSQRWDFSVTDKELNSIADAFQDDFIVPENFEQTAAPHVSSSHRGSGLPPKLFVNPQTTAFCSHIDITDPFAILIKGSPNKVTNIEFSFVEDLNITTASQKSLDPDGDCSSEGEDEPQNEEQSPDNLFFIDTKGVSSKGVRNVERMSLPPPKSQAPFLAENVLTNFPEYKEIEHSTLSETVVECPLSESILEADSKKNNEASPPKKFKRRNQAIYMNNDDDI